MGGGSLLGRREKRDGEGEKGRASSEREKRGKEKSDNVPQTRYFIL